MDAAQQKLCTMMHQQQRAWLMRKRLPLPIACISLGRNLPAHRKWHATASSQACGAGYTAQRVVAAA